MTTPTPPTTHHPTPPARPWAGLARRVQRLRRAPDHGGHAVEYAIGVGASAAIALGVTAALKTGLADVIATWVFR